MRSKISVFTGLLSVCLTAMVAPAVLAQSELPAILALKIGSWTGQLEYRDYQSNKWFGLDISVNVADGGDGATIIQTSDYDDGPRVGIVRITTIEMLQPDQTIAVANFRKGRPAELYSNSVAIGGSVEELSDQAREALGLSAKVDQDVSVQLTIATRMGQDDGAPAAIRTTTLFRGDEIISVKEVDPASDGEEGWRLRNRTRLKRMTERAASERP